MIFNVLFSHLKSCLLIATLLYCSCSLSLLYCLLAPKEFLVVAAETEILSISLDESIKSAPVPSVQRLLGAIAVDFDYEGKYVYFSQIIGKTISRIRENGSKIEDIVTFNKNDCKFKKKHNFFSWIYVTRSFI